MSSLSRATLLLRCWTPGSNGLCGSSFYCLIFQEAGNNWPGYLPPLECGCLFLSCLTFCEISKRSPWRILTFALAPSVILVHRGWHQKFYREFLQWGASGLHFYKELLIETQMVNSLSLLKLWAFNGIRMTASHWHWHCQVFNGTEMKVHTRRLNLELLITKCHWNWLVALDYPKIWAKISQQNN